MFHISYSKYIHLIVDMKVDDYDILENINGALTCMVSTLELIFNYVGVSSCLQSTSLGGTSLKVKMRIYNYHLARKYIKFIHNTDLVDTARLNWSFTKQILTLRSPHLLS